VVLTGGSTRLISNTYTSAPATLVNGNATFTIPPSSLYKGTAIVGATYTPDTASASLYTKNSGSTYVTVTGTAVPSLTVTPSATSITDQQSVNVTVTVGGTSGYPAPTGAVTLTSGSYSAQMALPNTLPNIGSSSNAAATFTIPAGTLRAGSNTLSAVYTGDGLYAVSSGTNSITVSQVLVAVPAPSPIAPGKSATATVTVTAGSSYSGTMNLSCSLSTSPANAQNLPTCSLNPATLTVGTGATKTTSLSLNTSGASVALVWPFNKLRPIGEGGLALAGLLMFGISSRRRRWIPMVALLAIVATVAGIGCGRVGGGSSNSTPPSTVATTAGTYVFTVTATDSMNTNITSSSTVSITVQ
jgi:trimeric autotransporter adhesin